MPKDVDRCRLELRVVLSFCFFAAAGSAWAQPFTAATPPLPPLAQKGVDAVFGRGDVPSTDTPRSPLKHHPKRLLVRFKPGTPPAARQAAHVGAKAERVLHELRCISGLCVVLVPDGALLDALAAYRADPTVLYAERDHVIRITEVPDDPEFARLWGMHNKGQPANGFFCFPTGTVGADIRALEAWDVWTGDPDFRVAVIDTGINYSHPDLAPNIWTNPGEIPDNGIDDDGNGWIDDVHGYDFHNQDGDPMDDHRHGSHVAGTIAAAGNNGIGVAGVNHQCSIVGLKVFDANGRGFTSSAVLALEYVIANGIRVSNNSWGCSSEESDCYSQALFDVIQASQSVGHIFVAAAGNDFGSDNDQIPIYPIGYDLLNIIGVAATENRDDLAIFSNLGAATVDLAAPGTCIYSTVLGSDYGYLDGTSMATPHVTGVVALVMSRLPDLNWQQVRTRVLQTTRPLSTHEGLTVTGGVVNAGAAVWDCNTNSIPDEQDIADGTSDDCNGNSLPDDCEPDCNGNGIADECDITSGFSSDCAANGIPDECEPDCNGNGVPDSCDIADGTSADCDGDGNGVPDECEPDCDVNGRADSCDILNGAPDCNHNGIPDPCEPGGDDDCNNNGTADLCDIVVNASRDCNDNGVPDECDIAALSSEDCTRNGIPDECEPDCNDNSLADSCDIASGLSIDCSSNGIPDECEPDCNLNDVSDICDIRDGTSNDCNENDVPDECEPGGTLANDCNKNGNPDLCDIFDGSGRDCNSNGGLDQCDISDGTSQDLNEDSVPDECEGKGYRLIPVGSSGAHTINDNEIVLAEGGQTVTLEVRLSGWDLDRDGQPRLRGFQTEIDVAGFTGGLYGTLSLTAVPCQTDDDCPGWQSACEDKGLCNEFGAVSIDLARADYVFADLISVWVVNFISKTPNFFILSAVFSQSDAVRDPGVELYGVTILVDVPDLVGGTFSIGFDPDDTVLADQNGKNITVPSFTPALITIPSDCNDNGVLDDEDIASGTSADCNNNGIPDECLHIEPDCNGNLVPDDCDIAGGQSQDCTADGIPDECDPDCNGNGVPDSCDIGGGTSADINVNGVPDECDPLQSIYVDTDNCFFPGAGTKIDPYCGIQIAIDSSGDGRQAIVEIVVADGIYTGLGNKNLEFGGRAITLRSSNGPGGCIIDAQGDGRAFIFREGDDAVQVSGFSMVNCSAGSGGAVFCRSSSPTISDCHIRSSTAERFGGAMYLTKSSPTIRNCRITGNTAEVLYGGGIYSFQSNPIISNSVIGGNHAELGGGLYCIFSSPGISNSTISGNTAEARGGGIYCTGASSSPAITNTILWGNQAPVGAELYVSGSATLTARYSDVADGPGQAVTAGGTLALLDGNFDGDPRFVQAEEGDFHLLPMSPCIESGDPDFVPEDGESDMDGEPRILLGIIDVGADEAPTFADCNGNGAPDGREVVDGLEADCNANDVLDKCDVESGTSSDEFPAGGDGIPDECQADCNGNGLPDDADITGGVSADCNANGIPDECDIGESASEDCDGNGVPDECEIYGDVNHDGIVDIFDLFCVLDGFAGIFDDCTFEQIDIAGCASDGMIDLFDLFGVLDGFAGINACCP